MFPYVFVTALAVSMAMIPLMMRLAPRIGMIDLPDPRKVHVQPVPRVGGIGIFFGAALAILLWVPLEPWVRAYLLGALVIVAFGIWDDAREMGHYFKFIGQFVAAGTVVYGGDVWVAHLPFLAAPIDPAAGKLFTVVAIVGMINAINHSDGLDGLAGGESLLSLAGLAYFGHLAGAAGFVMLIGAIVGGVFGFLRFNTHPAGVFMGDSGSQFLGYSLGVLTVVLTQQINTSLSMAAPLLILGLPIVDILAVFAQRVAGGMNWFRATKNHIHHRLLELGFPHYQVVVLIYSAQTLLVASAALLAYESDFLVTATYLGATGLVFALLIAAERRGWQAPSGGLPPKLRAFALKPVLCKLPVAVVEIAVPAYLVVGALSVETIPQDLLGAALAIGILALLSMGLMLRGQGLTLSRFAVYSASACVVSLFDHGGAASGTPGILDAAFFVLLALAIGAAIKFDPDLNFQTTPLDYLLVFAVLGVSLLAQSPYGDKHLGDLILRVTTLFYGCEVLIAGARSHGMLAMKWASCLMALVLLARSTL